MIHKKYLTHFIFLLLIVPALFLSTINSVHAASILCPAGTPDAGKICGLTGLTAPQDSIGYIRATCTLRGSDVSGGNRILGGQKCSIGETDDGGYYMTGTALPTNTTPTFPFGPGQAPGWTYSKSVNQITIPSIEWTTSDNVYIEKFFGGNVLVDTHADDESSIQIGSAVYGTTGCNSTGFRDVLKAGCPANTYLGNNFMTAQPGDTVVLNIQNDLRPNNGIDNWGSGFGSVTLNDLTACYTPTYKAFIGGYSDTRVYHPTASGVCSPSGSGGTPALSLTWDSNSSPSDTIQLTSGTSYQAPFTFKNTGTSNLTGINCNATVVSGNTSIGPILCTGSLAAGQPGHATANISNVTNSSTLNVVVNGQGVSSQTLSLTINPAPSTLSGTLTATGCSIPNGVASCGDASVTWNLSNPPTGSTTEVTHNNPGSGAATTSVSTSTSGSGVASTISYGTTTFYLYNSSQVSPFASAAVSASCSTGTQWNGTICSSSAPAKPDLTIFGDIAPATAVVGTPVTFSASVINLSLASTGTGFSNYFAISKENPNTHQITTTDLPASSMATLAAGGISTTTASTTFTLAGTYTVSLHVDATSRSGGGVIDEADEGNNVSSVTFTVVPTGGTAPVCGSDNGATLSSSPTNLCAAGTAGSVTGTGPWFWPCSGTGTDLSVVSCNAVKSAVPPPGTGGCGSPAAGSVTPTTNLCQSGYSSSSVSLDQPNAVYTWSCTDGNISHYSVCTSGYTGPVNAVCGIDKNVEAPSVPGSHLCSAGTSAGAPTRNIDDTYSWTCNGTGTPNGSNAACSTQQANISCTITSLTATPPNVLSGGTALLSWTTDSNCDSGYLVLADNTRYNTCYIDEDTGRSVCPNWPPNNIQEPTGTYTLTMTGAPYNGHTGTSTRSVTIGTASPSPDLVAGAVTPNTATANVAKIFSSTITNQGSTATGGSFPAFFQVATAANGGGTITDLTSSTVSNLPPGGNNTATKSYTFTANGIYSMRACADKTSSSGGGVVTEVDETNNCGVWTTITATGANVPPVVSAGPNKNIVPPISTVSVTGTATDPDGTISSTLWNFVSGPATATVVSPTALSTTFTGLTVNGIYIFRLSAWDNLSATSSAQMQVTVGAPVSLSPLTASPSTLYQRKDATTITWSSTGATACVGDSFPSSYTKNGILSEINSPFKGTRVLSGSISLNPPVSTSYTLTCTGAGGTATQSVQVKTVFPSATEQ
jgi:hypothetical protein